jgi:hypothetical protein
MIQRLLGMCSVPRHKMRMPSISLLARSPKRACGWSHSRSICTSPRSCYISSNVCATPPYDPETLSTWYLIYPDNREIRDIVTPCFWPSEIQLQMQSPILQLLIFRRIVVIGWR